MATKSAKPKAKVVAGTLGAATATLIVWGLQATGGVEVPIGVEGAIATLCGFGFGYITSE